ncbi:MAG: response regulator [Acidobacteria bacterium]|nr:MAG: response regulator [Acidobacteriota bacterium]REK00208.1 MAG: response regulator [Acidobacteriota bacterium]
MTDRLYTTNQLAKHFGVVPTTVIDWIEAGKLEAFKTLGGHRRITHRAVLEFLRRHGLPSPPAFEALTQKVVVLDDEKEILALFGRILRQGLPEIETILVDHPVEALMRIGSEQPQLVVFDIHMPDMDGFEFCRKLRESLTHELRLLAISGDTTDATREKVLAAGADRFIAKTDARDQLVTACQELLAAQKR